MCCEDLKIGRRTASKTFTRTLTSAHSVIADKDARRTAIIIGSSGASQVWFSTERMTGGDQGVLISTSGACVSLTLADHGDIVRGAINGWADAGPTTIGVIETIDVTDVCGSQ